MAAARDSVRKQGWWGAARRGALSRRCASTRFASRASPGLRGLLGDQESALHEAFLSLKIGRGLCTYRLRIIAPPRKPGTMPPYHPMVRGLCHDATPFLLSARGVGT